MSAATDTKLLHLPEGLAYTCHNEGVCCHVFDTIPLDPAAEQALAGLDYAALNTRAGNPPTDPIAVPNPAAPPGKKVARKPCGDCSMYTADNLCAIHALAGEPAKPRVCQDFPWRYVETPNGVYVGLSFVCPSVRANRGAAITDQAESLEIRYHSSGSIRSTPDQIPLNARITLEWDGYLAIESLLTDLLKMDTEPLPIRLIACCLVPGFIDQMLTQATAELPERPAGPVSGTPPPDLVRQIAEALRANSFAHILRIARKQTPPAARSRRMFLGMFTSFANTLHNRGQGRFTTVAGVMTQYVRHAAGLGTVVLHPVQARLSHSQLDLAVVPSSGYAADQLTRYMTHCIFRKDLALSGDLTRRVRLLALNAALVPWYAYAIAAAEGTSGTAAFSPPRDNHWDEAIGEVERLYGFHSAFYRFFEQNKVFSDIVDSFILKPTYPFTLFR